MQQGSGVDDSQTRECHQTIPIFTTWEDIKYYEGPKRKLRYPGNPFRFPERSLFM